VVAVVVGGVAGIEGAAEVEDGGVIGDLVLIRARPWCFRVAILAFALYFFGNVGVLFSNVVVL
jgi:hypothetical protein